MRKLAVALAVLASLTSSAFAAEGPLMVRLRGVYVQTADKSDAFTVDGVSIPADRITVGKKFIPEVDFSYFILPNLSAELILTYPQEHEVRIRNLGSLGTVTELPPCLTIQWHFLPGAAVNPYVGVGGNFTLVTDQDLVSPALPTLGVVPLKIDKTSVGVVGQVGADVKLGEKLYANLDVKYVKMGFDVKVKANDAKLTHVDVDPWLIGAGLGYRF